MPQEIKPLLEQLRDIPDDINEDKYSDYLNGLLSDFQSRNYYELMGVPLYHQVDRNMLTKTYRNLAKRLHPDKCRNKGYYKVSEDLFKMVGRAFDTLNDRDSENRYRAMLFSDVEYPINITVFFSCIDVFTRFHLLAVFVEFFSETLDESPLPASSSEEVNAFCFP